MHSSPPFYHKHIWSLGNVHTFPFATRCENVVLTMEDVVLGFLGGWRGQKLLHAARLPSSILLLVDFFLPIVYVGFGSIGSILCFWIWLCIMEWWFMCMKCGCVCYFTQKPLTKSNFQREVKWCESCFWLELKSVLKIE